ncbi:hypothetical protein [Maritalea porphyrae]|uniref:hypothetical protein n=1 Tax=Maritalea porphyrae TaxID=880732 RepID=UPI0022B011D4|nr:hypothetical protein [Maritalea porphyrae]MCZ4273643.1 hypothetical protein [Maritalea porphyrae]
MVIELMMFYALGFLCAIILALLFLPSIWRRAVRLTKKRIAATTPVTLSEFRAEKDQLRAQNALKLRKLELQLEDLRKKRATQLRELTQLRQTQELAVHEHEGAQSIAAELVERNQELQDQVRNYEVELTNISQKLRYRERDLAAKIEELDQARAAANIAASAVLQNFDDEEDIQAYEGDAKKLAKSLAAERKRNAFLEEQLRASMTRVQELKNKGRSSHDKTLTQDIPDLLDDAEAHIAIATERFNALLNAQAKPKSNDQELLTENVTDEQAALHATAHIPTAPTTSLAEELMVEDELEDVGSRIMALEEDILTRFSQEASDIDDLRDRMQNIAVDISHIIYAQDSAGGPDGEESLFDRVRKYADDGLDEAVMEPTADENVFGRVADRMDALKKSS